MDGYRIVLENRLGCELESRFVLREEFLTESIVLMVRECTLTPGDKIRIEEAWSEDAA